MKRKTLNRKTKKTGTEINSPDNTRRSPENINTWRRSFALRRRQAGIEKEKLTAEQEQLKIFRQKTDSASDKKAPRTKRTRGYYRFSKVYPELTDENGFRELKPDKKRMRRLIFAGTLLAAAVFCAAFIVTRSMTLISKDVPADAAVSPTQPQASAQTRIYRFSREELENADTDAMLQKLSDHGCNAALFEIKDSYGRLMVSTGQAFYAGTDGIVLNSAEIFSKLKENGITLCGYISCFKDTAAAYADLSLAVRKNSAEGGVWTDNSDSGHLNPFSARANEYLIKIISSAAEAGMDVIVLDEVCFSTDSGSSQAFYPGENSTNDTRNSVLVSFINSAVKNAGNAKIIVMAPYNAFDFSALPDSPGYAGNLLSTGAGAVCVDARPSMQKKNISVGDEVFYDASSLQLPFILAAADFTAKNIALAETDQKLFVCVENSASLKEQTEAAVLSGAYGYIIW